VVLDRHARSREAGLSGIPVAASEAAQLGIAADQPLRHPVCGAQTGRLRA
jgi:hypothetical protein